MAGAPPGARIGVCWDKDRADWQQKANVYRARRRAEEKENGGAPDLDLQEFEYTTSAPEDATDENAPGDEDEDDVKQMDDDAECQYPDVPEIPNPQSSKGLPIVSPSVEWMRRHSAFDVCEGEDSLVSE